MRNSAKILRSVLALITAAAICTSLFAAQRAARGTARSGANGAIAYHRDSKSYGYSYDFATARQAKVEALKQCEHAKCEVMVSFRSSCGALANGPKKAAASTGAVRQEAETKALRKCGDEACEIVAWACTR